MAADASRRIWSGFLLKLPAAALLGTACAAGPTQPTAPFGQGVSLYPDSLYRGKTVTIDGDVSDLSRLRGPCAGSDDEPSHFDDCTSSLRIPAGWSATLFRDRRFEGASITYTEDVPDLDVVAGPCRPGFNDCISSIRVQRTP
jgi:hypothetical protein